MKWIISEMFYPDEVSTALIMTEIAEKYAVSEKVGVICGPKGYEKSYSQQDKSLNNNIKIFRVNSINLDKNKILLRITKMFMLTLGMAFKTITKVKKGDEVLLVTNPIFLLPIVAGLKKLRKYKLNVLVHDVFPDNLIPAQLAKSSSFKFKTLNKVFNWSYRQADNLISLGEDMRIVLENKIKTDVDRIKIIPNWYDPSVFPLVDFSSSSYYNIDLSEKIIIGFAGNIGRVQGLDKFIDYFIQADNQNLFLVLVGDGAFRTELEQKINQQGIKNILFAGSKPREEQNMFLNACDIGLITLSEGMKGIGVPSKTYNIMAVGKPILYIGDKQSEVDHYIDQYKNGWSFDWRDNEALVNFLRELNVNERQKILDKGIVSLEKVRSNFSKENILELFNQLTYNI